MKVYNLVQLQGTVYEQTFNLLKRIHWLKEENYQILKMWFYLQDIDKNYKFFNQARNDFYDSIGLMHGPYYASTCIGRPDSFFKNGTYLRASVLYDYDGTNQSKIVYMSNETVMPHPKYYNVRFERGIIYIKSEKYRYIVSGTASINPLGNVVYPNLIYKQIEQTLNNINSLLEKYNQSLTNAKKIVGYVRNPEQIKYINDIINELYPKAEITIVEGKVCRPDWLVEVEAII